MSIDKTTDYTSKNPIQKQTFRVTSKWKNIFWKNFRAFIFMQAEEITIFGLDY